jgi:hypothetical protein
MSSLFSAYSGGLRISRQPLRGVHRVDWSHPVLNGISYLYIFNKLDILGGASDFTGSGQLIVARNNAKIGIVSGGIGLTSDGISDANSSTYGLPVSSGSLFAFVTASWSPTDGGYHNICNFGASGGNTFYLYKNGSGSPDQWHGGWSDDLGFNATGTFNIGEPFSVGVTWTSTPSFLQAMYVKGNLVTSTPSGSSGATAGKGINIGALDNLGNWKWDTNGTSGIHYIAIWNRALQPEEISLLYNDPYCFLLASEGEMPALRTAAAASAVVFRRTLSQVGTRVGSRQSHGWN